MATRHRIYRSLFSFYLLAGLIYMEEGDFQRALGTLNKASRIAYETGVGGKGPSFLSRYAVTLAGMGRYGDALRYARLALERSHEAQQPDHRLGAITIMLRIHGVLGTTEADSYGKRAESIAEEAQSHNRVGWYQMALGFRDVVKERWEAALIAFSNAIDEFEQAGWEDDYLRAKVYRARVLVELGDIPAAERAVEEIGMPVAQIGVPAIQTNYQILCLQLAIAKKDVAAARVEIATCEARSALAHRFRIHLDLDGQLIRGYDFLGDAANVQRRFAIYYDRVKELCSNLSSREFADSFVQRSDFLQIMQIYKRSVA